MLMTRRALSSSRSFSLDLVHSEGAGHRRAAPLVRVTVGRRLAAAKLLARVRDTLCWLSTRGALGWSPQPVRAPPAPPCPWRGRPPFSSALTPGSVWASPSADGDHAGLTLRPRRAAPSGASMFRTTSKHTAPHWDIV